MKYVKDDYQRLSEALLDDFTPLGMLEQEGPHGVRTLRDGGRWVGFAARRNANIEQSTSNVQRPRARAVCLLDIGWSMFDVRRA